MFLFMFLTLLLAIPLMVILPQPWGGLVFTLWWISCSVYAMWKEPMHYPSNETYKDRFYKEVKKRGTKNNKPLIIDVD